MGSGSSTRVNTRALPILELEDGSMATTHTEAADGWRRHFAADEVAAAVPTQDAEGFYYQQPQLGTTLTHDIAHADIVLPTLADCPQACRAARPSAA
eukprot:2269565-Pyramimonas_sp.AAC.2